MDEQNLSTREETSVALPEPEGLGFSPIIGRTIGP